jgi:8-oxo-dGTP pyrophosphatase MutT (NUDIX family)
VTRSFTVDDVRAACATLPSPGWQKLFAVAAPRAAALLVPVVDDGGEAAVILTKRSATMPSHRDDWVFPGGGLDDTDTSHAEAARREAAEELGVDPATIEIIGQLDTRGPIMTGYLIETYVAVVSARELHPDPREVAEVTSVRLGVLLDAGFRAPIDPGHDPGPPAGPVTALNPTSLHDLRHYLVREGEHLWGLQAEILFELLAHLTAGTHQF